MKAYLWLRARLAWTWRLGIIGRGTAFRWEMDESLGEYSRPSREEAGIK